MPKNIQIDSSNTLQRQTQQRTIRETNHWNRNTLKIYSEKTPGT